MNLEFNQKIQLVKEKINIVDIIGRYLKLSRKGNNYWAICPFHQDSSPSMSVSQDKQIYKCFSCGEQGNAFIFLQKYKKIDFITALKELAEVAKIDLKTLNLSTNEKKDKHPLKKLNDLALSFYQYQLTTEPAKKALEYLKSRGMEQQTLNDFAIGYAPKANELVDYLKMQGYEYASIVEAGLAKINDQDEVKDMFINRIVFPIIDIDGSCLGFSARRYIKKENDNFKYVNTPETEIFKKGKILYNLFNAKNSIHTNNDNLYLVEGYMDVIALNHQNIKNCVALMGTNLTKEQLVILKKITNNIIIFLDGDEPGKMAAYKIAINLLLNNFNVKVINNSSNLDPDELASQDLKKFNLIINQTMHPMEFAIKFFNSKYDIKKDSDQLKEFLLILKPMWQALTDAIARKFYLDYLINLTNLNEQELVLILNDKKPEVVNKEDYSSSPKKVKKFEKITVKDKLLSLQKQLIYLLLLSRTVFTFLEQNKFIFCNQKLMNLYFLINQKYNEQKDLLKIDIDQILVELKENEIFSFLNEIIETYEKKKFEINETILKDYLRINQNYIIEIEIELLKNQINQSQEIEEKIKLLKKMSSLKNKLT